MTGSAACRSNTLSSPQRLSSTLLRITFNMISMYVWITCTPNPFTLETWHPLMASTPPTHSEADCLSAQIIYEQPFIFKYICTHIYMYAAVLNSRTCMQLPCLFFYFLSWTCPPCGTDGNGLSAHVAAGGRRYWHVRKQLFGMPTVELAGGGGGTCISTYGGQVLLLAWWC